MGQDIRSKSEAAYNSYLTLGLLEIASNASPKDRKSYEAIIENFPEEKIDARNIGRYISRIRKWLKNGGLDNVTIKKTLHTNTRGTLFEDEIPIDIYNDFVSSFLMLNLIEDYNHTILIKDTFPNNYEKPLSIVTKLVIAKKDQKKIKIILNNDNIILFIPSKFEFKQMIWSISGRNISENIEIFEIQLKDILSIEYSIV